jgi:hypothetical protein
VVEANPECARRDDERGKLRRLPIQAMTETSLNEATVRALPSSKLGRAPDGPSPTTRRTSSRAILTGKRLKNGAGERRRTPEFAETENLLYALR